MADYRVVCTEQVPVAAHPQRARIVAVGTGSDPDQANQRWTVPEVVAAMDRGDRFYTQGKASGRVAWVQKYWCAACGACHIRTASDATVDNNLDYLRACSWRQ
jgi:hypothetical protein